MEILRKMGAALLSLGFSYWLNPHIVKHWEAITLSVLVTGYIWFKFFRYQPKCPGCETCDPQAFIDEYGEIDPGINNFRTRSR